MSNDIQATATTAVTIADKLADYARQADGAFSSNTARAIRADTAIFAAWCAGQGHVSLPAKSESVADFIDAMAEIRKPATVRRYVASIGHLHRAAELADPTKANPVKLALKRLGRQHGSRQTQAAPFGALPPDGSPAPAASELVVDGMSKITQCHQPLPVGASGS